MAIREAPEKLLKTINKKKAGITRIRLNSSLPEAVNEQPISG